MKGKVIEVKPPIKKTVVAQRLKQLEKKFGRITPDIVVDDAMDPKSPLHTNAGFDWDEGRAARAHWREHARHLIASVRVQISTANHTYSTVNYVRDPRVPKNEQGFVSVEKLRKNKDWAREAIDFQIKQVLSQFERLRDLAEPLGQQARVEAMIADLQKFMAQVAA